MINGTIGTHDGTGTPAPWMGTNPHLGGLTVAEASVSLGVSVNTIRRWIKEGRLRSERVATPTGYAYRVFPDGVPVIGTRAGSGTDSGAHADSGIGTDQLAAGSSVALETQRAEAMAVYTKTLLEPLVARLAEQEAVVRDQAETIGRQGAELERATTAAVALGDELAAAEASRRRDHRPAWIGLAVAGAVAIAVVAAPTWVR